MSQKLAKTQILLLLVAGVLLTLVATFIIVSPNDFFAANSIELGTNVSLLNELKAPAGFLLAAGLFMLSAIFIRPLADTAMLLATMIYLSYAASRLVSMLFDGVPATGLVQAAALEAVVGLACLMVLMMRRLPVREAA